MSNLKAKMHRNRFRLGQLVELTALPRSSSWIKAPTSKWKGGEGERKGSGEEGREGKEKRGWGKEGSPPCVGMRPPHG